MFGSQNNNATTGVHKRGSPDDSSQADDSQDETDQDGAQDARVTQYREVTKGGRNENQRNDRIEAKIEQLSNNLIAMQNLMMQQGRFGGKPLNDLQDKEINQVPSGQGPVRQVVSGTTIYKDALEFQEQVEGISVNNHTVNGQKRDSSSSDEPVDTSDEMLVEMDETDKFINSCIVGDGKQDRRGGRDREEPQPSTSRYQQGPRPRELSRGEEMVKEAETAKARMLATSGKPDLMNLRVQSSMVDEDYVVISANIDDNMCHKIQNNEYVDFGKLLPRDRIMLEEDHRMELVSKGGLTYFTPVSDRDNGGISSFSKWEQAFRVFSNIYSSKFADRASELIQYNHVIYLASLSFQWENVYLYDKEFRLHMSRHPERSWAVILQQAWTLRLKDRIRHDNWWSDNTHEGQRQKVREPCRRYNRGKCNYGPRCKFEHRCSVRNCGKFRHGAHVCRKRTGYNGESPARVANHAPNNGHEAGKDKVGDPAK